MSGSEPYGLSLDLLPGEQASQKQADGAGALVSQLLDEANHARWESLASALGMADGQPHPRVGRLVQHVSVSKRGYWEAIAAAIATPRQSSDQPSPDQLFSDQLFSDQPPPELNLNGVCLWEVQRAAALSDEQLATVLTYSGRQMSVTELLRLNARHTVWHAGQIAALSSGPKLA